MNELAKIKAPLSENYMNKHCFAPRRAKNLMSNGVKKNISNKTIQGNMNKLATIKAP